MRYALLFLDQKQLFWLVILNIFNIFSTFLAFYFYGSCKTRLMFWRVITASFAEQWLDFYKIPIPLAFIFIILDFKDVVLFYLLQSNSYRKNFLIVGFLLGQCSLPEFSLERKFRENLLGNIFEKEVSSNR